LGDGVLRPSPKAYKISSATTRQAELQRETRSLLNKICPENREKIIEQLIQTRLGSVEEMEIVINIIFCKVTNDPHYCETYVDMICALSKAYPEFPPQNEGEAPIDFRRMLVNTCQAKFEDMLSKVEEDATDVMLPAALANLQEILLKQKCAAMATMKFVGHLYVRQLVAAPVIARVAGELLEGSPAELQVEYVLELLRAVGWQFDSTKKNEARLSSVLVRLTCLKTMKSGDRKPYLSRRLQFQIQDLLDLRANGWEKKAFKEEAKTLDSLREDQAREDAQAPGRPERGARGTRQTRQSDQR